MMQLAFALGQRNGGSRFGEDLSRPSCLGPAMDTLIDGIDAWITALVFAAAMFGSWLLGWQHGHRQPREMGDDPATKFTDATMVLLGLLLAFTFSMALARHEHRRQAVVAESNAIGDFYTCASLLQEPHRSRLQKVIHDYAVELLATPYETLSGAAEEAAQRRFETRVADMTAIVNAAIAEGTPIAISLTNTLNNVTSTNAARLAAYQDRLPWSIVMLLFLGSLVPVFLIGEKQAAVHKVHWSGPICFIILVTLVIYVTLDLNEPRRGLIQVSQVSLERAIHSMGH
jgi:hypothetical protein